MKGFKNVLAYVDGKGVINCDIAVENGVIKEIGTKLDITEPFPYRDGDVVLPGFIDEHIHGADGVDVQSCTRMLRAVAAPVSVNAARGVDIDARAVDL